MNKDRVDPYVGTNISMSNRERNIIVHLANSRGLTFSAAARVIINEWNEDHGNQPPTAEPEYHGEGAA